MHTRDCYSYWREMSFDLKVKNGDLVIENGDLATVSGSNKLIQDILKIAQTPAGANPAIPWYGSYVSKSIVGSALDTSIILEVGKSQLQSAIQTLMELQVEQVKSGQNVSADEQIKSIVDINIRQNKNNPTYFFVTIKVLSKGLKTASANFEISPF